MLFSLYSGDLTTFCWSSAFSRLSKTQMFGVWWKYQANNFANKYVGRKRCRWLLRHICQWSSIGWAECCSCRSHTPHPRIGGWQILHDYLWQGWISKYKVRKQGLNYLDYYFFTLMPFRYSNILEFRTFGRKKHVNFYAVLT